MLWYYDMSCSAVRSGGVFGHEPHFSASFVRSVLPSQEELESNDSRDQYDRL
jgi:hypothetical protein